MCNQLLIYFLTKHACCGHNEGVLMVFFMRLELILTVIFGSFCAVGYGDCIINSCYSFQCVFLKLCRHIVDILKMCIWAFDGDKINFDRITAF